MPAHGDQYRDTPATTNPFSEQKPHISEYTAKEVATLQSRLDKQLGPEYISTRPGNGGGKVHYLAAEKVINLANEVFGFNGWSSAIQNVQIDFVDENPQNGRINLGLSTIVRVTLKDGTFHEDIGYGHCENIKGKAAAFEKAKKEAATDAMKRALRNFGNVLGNCLYDKDYLQKVTKVKIAPSKWDAENLHRHPDFVTMKRESITENILQHDKGSTVQRNHSAHSTHSHGSFGSAEFEEDFGGNTFDESDFTHADEVHADDSTTLSGDASPLRNTTSVDKLQQHPGQKQGSVVVPSVLHAKPPHIPPLARVQSMQAPQKPQEAPRPPARSLSLQALDSRPKPLQAHSVAMQQTSDGSRLTSSSGQSVDQSPDAARPGQFNCPDERAQLSTLSEVDGHEFPIPQEPPQGIPAGFVTGRRAELFQQPSGSRSPNANAAFNPHADSPSIRRTQGINPGRSAPVSRMQVTGGGAVASSPGPLQPDAASLGVAGNSLNGPPKSNSTNFVNPSADMNRRIGMPQAVGLQNRAPYRPPAAVKRPAMIDVTNTFGTNAGSDLKKTRSDDGPPSLSKNAQVEE